MYSQDLEIIAQDTIVYCDSSSTACETEVDVVIEVAGGCSELMTSYEMDLFDDGQVDETGNGVMLSGSYPVGDHMISWLVTDTCGESTQFLQRLIIADCVAPEPRCFPGTVTVIMEANDEVTIWSSDFDAGASDNCGDYVTSFSEDTDDIFLTIPCHEAGPRLIEVWITDDAGNQDFCQTFINVQGRDDCGDPLYLSFGGQVATVSGEPMPDVTVFQENRTSSHTIDYLTDEEGRYQTYGNPLFNNYRLTAAKDGDILNGVSTFDIVLIQAHLLGLRSFESLDQFVSADVNGSGGVSAADLADIRRLLLGHYPSGFPNSPNWRFLNASIDLDNLQDAELLTESWDLVDVYEERMDIDFYGVKMGDVNRSAMASGLLQSEDRTPDGSLLLSVEDRDVSPGERLELDVLAHQFSDVLGFQMTWEMEGVELESLEGGSMNMTEQNIGRQSEIGSLAMSWSDGSSVSLRDKEVLFTLHLRANVAGRLSELISMSSNLLRSEAYTSASNNMVVELEWFDARPLVSQELVRWNNYPNPFQSETMIEFILAKASDVNISITDAKGSAVKVIEGEYAAGIHQIKLNRSDLNAGGVYIYELSAAPQDGSDACSGVKKMIVLD